MSEDLSFYNAIDPRIAFGMKDEEKKEWGVIQGPKSSNVVRQNANSYSTSGFTFNFNTQSENVAISRIMYVEAEFDITLTSGNNTSGGDLRILTPGNDGVRSFPLTRCSRNIRFQLNNCNVSVQANTAIDALSRYNIDFDIDEYDLSGTCATLDCYQEYAGHATSARNPLADFQNSPLGGKTGRGGRCISAITANPSIGNGNNGAAVVRVKIFEPVLISPLMYKQQDNEESFIGIQNMGVEFSFDDLNKLWCHAVNAALPIASTSVAVVGVPKLHVSYLTPPETLVLPQYLRYDYSELRANVNDTGLTITSNAQETVNMNSIQLKSVPKSIYIWCTLPENQKGVSTTDTYFAIENLSLSYLNVAGQFASMSSFDLYEMSVKNGLNMSYDEWRGQTFDLTGAGAVVPLCGGVIKIDASDLSLGDIYASGMNVNSQLQFSLTVKNVSAADKRCQVNVLVETEAMMIINTSNGDVQTIVGVLDAEDVVQTRAEGEHMEYDFHNTNLSGGKHGRGRAKVRNFFKKVGRFLTNKKTWQTVGHIANSVAPLLAAGEGGRLSKTKGKRGGAMVAGSLTGGKQLSKKELKELLLS